MSIVIVLPEGSVSTMKYMLTVAVVLLSMPHVGLGQSKSGTSSTLSSRDVHNLIRTARTGEQYRQLADYFHVLALDNRTKAAAEIVERDRRAQVNAGLYQKYRRPVDSAQYLYESYVAAAAGAALQAHHYDQLAMAQGQHAGQSTTSPADKP
jgi:hypothetical protein